MFFYWISKITCIESFKGIGDELHLYVNAQQISLENFLSLHGLVRRYKINEEQLAPLKKIVEDQKLHR